MSDVLVVERRERFGLPPKTSESLGVAREEIGKDLDRYVAPQVRVAGAVDLAHAPDSDQRGDFVGTEAGS